MKLARYNHYTEADGYNGDFTIKDAYIVLLDTDTVPVEYTLISDTDVNALINFHQYADEVCPLDIDETYLAQFGEFVNFKDWKCLRKEVIARAEAITGGLIGSLTTVQWNMLTAAQKDIVVQYAISKLSASQILDAVPVAEIRSMYSLMYDTRSQISRKKRFIQLRGFVMKAISVPDALKILKDMESAGLVQGYYGGLEGVDEGDSVSGLFDFVKTQNDYAINGLTTYTLTFNTGYDMTILKNGCLAKLTGIY